MKLQKIFYALYFLIFILWSPFSYGVEFPRGLSHCLESLSDLAKIKVGETVVFNNGGHFQKGVTSEFKPDGTIVIDTRGTSVEFKPSSLNSIHPYRPNSSGIGATVLYRYDGYYYRKAQVIDRVSFGWALLDEPDHYIYEGDLRPYEKVSDLQGIKINDTVLVEDHSPTRGFYSHIAVVTDITAVGLIQLDGENKYRFSTTVKPYLPPHTSLTLTPQGGYFLGPNTFLKRSFDEIHNHFLPTDSS